MATDLLEPPVSTETEFAPITRIDASFNGTLLSPEEFDAIDDWDEDYEYELIRGVVIVNPIPSDGEVVSVDFLGYLLRDYQQRPEGKALDATLPERYVFLPDGSRRKADRVLWVGLGRKPKPKTEVPSIIVEFVSKSHRDYLRDYIDKRGEYLAAGVKEYWVIDRFRGKLTVFKPPNDEVVVQRHETYRTDLLPGFELPLERLLAVADEWKE
jgi:Uma2 family endonuclease